MAYYNIEKRLKSDGTPRYRCNVIIKEKGVITYRESKTFPKHAHAKTWGTQKVMELDLYGIPSSNAVDGLTVRDLLHKYLNDPNAGGKAGRTKRYVLELLMDSDISAIKLSELTENDVIEHCRLELLMDSDISAIKLSELTENDVIEHCRLRNNAGAGPATVSHDVSYLGSVLDAAKPVYGINYTSNPAKAARPYLLKLGLIGKSNRRNRRPASDELDMLIEGLQQRSTHKCSKIPFVDILKFSVWSCMRIGEVCRLRWEDLDQEQKSILVRDRKDPRKKEGNHMKVALLGEAWDIVQRQPKKSEFIFPYNSTSVTAGFQRVRSKLGIKDLRYHDLRREGASRLFEAGFSIEEVAQVTGHRSLNVLWQVYTELYPKSLHNRFEELQRSRNKTS
ncbi:tyrosine-type recombinase/integrase [Escherichia coli]|uniref:tyrosine-type recombinase/integrase n=3 Tax=Enterobacteriaceae TaxID=543 RepID=UPI0007194770|nr:site-specific integrase [Escherichia coli]